MSCATCGLAAAFEGFDDCLPCAIAGEIHENQGATLPLWKTLWAGTEWLHQVEREYTRQTTALSTERSAA